MQKPIFYYNGIKDAKGAKLQKATYSAGGFRSFPEGTVCIYGKNYRSFSQAIRASLAVTNDTDSQSDYFCNDHIYVLPDHPLHKEVLAAYTKQQTHRAKRNARLNVAVAA